MMGAEVAFRTIVEMPNWKQKVFLKDHHVFLGSCFAENIGQRFLEYGLNALLNPVGVLYNPRSVCQVIRQAFLPQSLPIFQASGVWHCWLSNSMLNAQTEDECVRINQDAFSLLSNAFRQADHVFLTYGTNVCYSLKESSITVSNCHKQPQSLFSEYVLSLNECIEEIEKTVSMIQNVNSRIQIHFTVSPYRYAKYGYHNSQLAKSTLLLAIDCVCAKHSDVCSYLPIYEIVLDELRDYRFYNSDMLHPSPVAIDYIWQRLIAVCADEVLQNYLQEYEPIRKALSHRPLDAESDSYKAFSQNIQNKITNLKKKYLL